MRVRTNTVTKTLFSGLFFAMLLSGCIVVKTTEHRIKLNDDGSGEALLRLIDIRSDAPTDSLMRRDFTLMMAGAEQQGVKEFERAGRKVTNMQFSVRGDTLMCEVSYTFREILAVEGMRQTKDGIYMVVSEDREIVKTNGDVESWQHGGQRISWNADARRLVYIVKEKAPAPSRSLAGLYLKSYR